MKWHCSTWKLTIPFQTLTRPTTVLNIPRTMAKTGLPSKFLKVVTKFRDIDASIKQQMRTNNHYDDENDKYFISVSANSSTLKTVLTLANGYQVDFGLPNSMRHVLGFNSAVYTTNYQELENVVNIMNINSILVNIDIITRSYVNGQMQPVIYSLFSKRFSRI